MGPRDRRQLHIELQNVKCYANEKKAFGVYTPLYTAARLCMIRNVDESHWYIIVADTERLQYYILDSLGRRLEAVLPTDTRRRMAEVFDLISAIRGEDPPRCCTWRQVLMAFPQQRNNFDCGIFAVCGMALILAGARLESLGEHPWLQQDQMAARRREAADGFTTGIIPASWKVVGSRGRADAAAAVAKTAAAAAAAAAADAAAAATVAEVAAVAVATEAATTSAATAAHAAALRTAKTHRPRHAAPSRWRLSTDTETRANYVRACDSISQKPFWLNGLAIDILTELCSNGLARLQTAQLIPGDTTLQALEGADTPVAAALRATKRQQLRVRAPHCMAVAPELRTAERLCLFRNVAGSHWYLIVVEPVTRRYYILDSLGPRYEKVLPSDSLRRMPEVLDLINAIRGETHSDGWRQVPVFFPKQTNGFDCGLFAISAAALVLAGAKLSTLGFLPWIQQDRMGERRAEAAESLMSGVIPDTWRSACAGAVAMEAQPKTNCLASATAQPSLEPEGPPEKLGTPARPGSPARRRESVPSTTPALREQRSVSGQRKATPVPAAPLIRAKATPLDVDQQLSLCSWARQVWAVGGTVTIVTDGSYKERTRLVNGRLCWSAAAGCAWVVGSDSSEDGTGDPVWQVIGSHGVHPATAGERPLSNYEAELYGIIGFFREWNTLPWGPDSCTGELCLWSDCGTAIDLILARATRLEVRWRRTAASPAWSEIQQHLRRWPGYTAAWIRGHADSSAGSAPLNFVQQGNVLADLHADRGRMWAEDNAQVVPEGPQRPSLTAHLTSGAILWTGRSSSGPLTIEGNLAKGWRKLNGLHHTNKYREERPLRLSRAGDLDIKMWQKKAVLDWKSTVFRSKLWNDKLATADVHARNHDGPSALSDIRTCTLCLQADLGDAWHAIGLCAHPTLAALRISIAGKLRESAQRAGKACPATAATWKHVCDEFARVNIDGRWDRPFKHGAPNHWYGEFPHDWMYNAAKELGVLVHGDSNTDPIRELKTFRLQLRSLSQEAVHGASEIWSAVCTLWREVELEGPKALAAARKTELQENRIYYSAEAELYQQQAAAAMQAGGPALSNTTAWLEIGRANAERVRSGTNPARLVRTTTLHECWGRVSQTRHQADRHASTTTSRRRSRKMDED